MYQEIKTCLEKSFIETEDVAKSLGLSLDGGKK